MKTIKNYFNIEKQFNEHKTVLELKFFGYVGEYENINLEALEEALNQYDKIDEINIKIFSGGGSIYSGYSLYNTLKNTGAIINTENISICASMGAVLFLAGNGKRSMHRNSTYLMIHNPSVYAGGESKDLEKQAEHLKKLKDDLINLMQVNSSLSYDEISTMMDNTTYLNAQEAFDAGFCNDIIEIDAELPDEAKDAMAKLFDTEKIPADVMAVFQPKEIENDSENKDEIDSEKDDEKTDKTDAENKDIDSENKDENKVEIDIDKSENKLSDEILAKISEAYDDGVFAGKSENENKIEYENKIVDFENKLTEKTVEIDGLKSEIDSLKDENEKIKNGLDSLGSGLQEPIDEIEKTYNPNYKNVW